MNNYTYAKIPLQIYADICPVCGLQIEEVRNIKFIARKKNGNVRNAVKLRNPTGKKVVFLMAS